MLVRYDDAAIQGVTPLPLHTGAYFSRALGREQSYAYFAPPEFDAEQTPSDTRYPLLILLHGRKANYRVWPEQTRLAFYAASVGMFLAFPEGGEGWYANAYDGQANYEDDLMQDFLPHLQQNWPLLPPGKNWTIGGMSMGGQGAIKIALKYGQMFSLALSFSGAFEITRARNRIPFLAMYSRTPPCAAPRMCFLWRKTRFPPGRLRVPIYISPAACKTRSSNQTAAFISISTISATGTRI